MLCCDFLIITLDYNSIHAAIQTIQKYFKSTFSNLTLCNGNIWLRWNSLLSNLPININFMNSNIDCFSPPLGFDGNWYRD